MKIVFQLLLYSMFIYSVFGQTLKKQPEVKKASIDTFSRNITAAVKKVTTLAINPKVTGFSLTREYGGADFYQHLMFTTPVNLPGSEKVFVRKLTTDRTKGITNWEWGAVIVTAPKGTMFTKILDAKNKTDSILLQITTPKANDIKHQIVRWYTTNLYTADYINYSLLKKDSLALVIQFTKPVHNTEKEAMDSLIKLYKPLLFDVKTAGDAASNFGYSLQAEGIGNNKIQNLFNSYLKEIAEISMPAAYKVIMKCPAFLDYMMMKDGLTYDQQQVIKGMATKTMEELNEWQRQKNKPVVIEEKKPETVPPKSYCEQNLAKQKYKPGTYFSLKSGFDDDYFIVSFNCNTNEYVMASTHYVQPRKTFFKTNENVGYHYFENQNISEETLNQWYKVSSKKYLICNVCNGSGVVYIDQVRTKGGEWEQLNFNVFLYTPGRVTAEWKERRVCTQCYGAGRKEIH